jgi:hypothetical protein
MTWRAGFLWGGHGRTGLPILAGRQACIPGKSLEFPNGVNRPAGRPGGAEKTALGQAVDGMRAGAEGVRGFLAREREFQVLGGGLNRVVHDGAESSIDRLR